MHSRLTAAALFVIVASGAAVRSSRDLPRTAVTPPHVAATVGMRAYIDPVTHELLPGPAPGQRELPLSLAPPDNRKLEILHMEDGSIGVLFHGQRQATVVATLSDDGSVKTECIENTAAQTPEPEVATEQRHE